MGYIIYGRFTEIWTKKLSIFVCTCAKLLLDWIAASDKYALQSPNKCAVHPPDKYGLHRPLLSFQVAVKNCPAGPSDDDDVGRNSTEM